MQTTSLTTTIVVLTAAEGKILTDGREYVHTVALASSEDASRWMEVDVPVDYEESTVSTVKFDEACEQFRGVCAQIAQFTGIENFHGGFDEYASFMQSEAFQSNPVAGLTLAMLWSGANEYCVYEGAKIGLGQPDWWYRCWGFGNNGMAENLTHG